MDSSSLRSLATFLVLGGGLYYAWDHSQRAGKWQEINDQASSAEKRIAELKVNTQALEQKVQPLRDISSVAEDSNTSTAKLKEDIDQCRNDITRLNKELDDETTALEVLIDLVRKESIGRTLPDFTTEGGEVVSKPILKRFVGSTVVLELADGVRRFVSDELPQDVVKRFALDYIPNKEVPVVDDKAFADKIAGSGKELLGAADLDPEIAALSAQCLLKSQAIRDTGIKARQMERAAFADAAAAGRRGDSGSAQMSPKFAQAKALRDSIKGLQAEFNAIRKKRDDMRRLKLDMTKNR